MTLFNQFGQEVKSEKQVKEETVAQLYNGLAPANREELEEAGQLADAALPLMVGRRLKIIVNACMMILGSQMCAMPSSTWDDASEAIARHVREHIRLNAAHRAQVAERVKALGSAVNQQEKAND